MRTIVVSFNPNTKKYTTYFNQGTNLVWSVESYIIEAHEVMVSWIEHGKVPPYRYR